MNYCIRLNEKQRDIILDALNEGLQQGTFSEDSRTVQKLVIALEALDLVSPDHGSMLKSHGTYVAELFQLDLYV